MPSIVNCVYPLGHRFNLNYYINTFMPKAFAQYKPQGMTGYEIVHYTASPESPWTVQILMYWESVGHFDKAMENGGHDLDEEIKVFSGIDPDTLGGDIVGSYP